MKVLIYSDLHWCQDSSIVRSMGDRYSTRLQYLIKSLNWAERLASTEGCDAIFNLGDTFDKPFLNAMEITALKDVEWNADLPHFILVGNHDSNVNNLEYSSTTILSKLAGFNVISSPIKYDYVDSNISFVFLPYMIEDNRKAIRKYIDELYGTERPMGRVVILSHNDIKGFQFGKFRSPEGFDVEDIENNCDLYLNGHLHAPSFLTKRIINVGNLCGQNFSEDNFKTDHSAWILNTDDLSLESYTNPYALNFFKLEINDEHPSLDSYALKDNSCLMIRCERKYMDALRKEISDRHNITCYKIIVYDNELSGVSQDNIRPEKVDYLKTFNDFIIEKLGNTDIIKDELGIICK